MANDKISNMTAAAVAALTGTGAAVEVSTGIGGVPATKQGLLRDLRTAMFAGGTGYTASDPLVCGTLDASGNASFTSGVLQVTGVTNPKLSIKSTSGTTDDWSFNVYGPTQELTLINNTSGYGTLMTVGRLGAFTIGSTLGGAGNVTIASASTIVSGNLSVAGTSTLTGNVGIGEASTATSGLHLKLANIPTSSAGLASGDVWRNSNVLTIVP